MLPGIPGGIGSLVLLVVVWLVINRVWFAILNTEIGGTKVVSWILYAFISVVVLTLLGVI